MIQAPQAVCTSLLPLGIPLLLLLPIAGFLLAYWIIEIQRRRLLKLNADPRFRRKLAAVTILPGMPMILGVGAFVISFNRSICDDTLYERYLLVSLLFGFLAFSTPVIEALLIRRNLVKAGAEVESLVGLGKFASLIELPVVLSLIYLVFLIFT